MLEEAANTIWQWIVSHLGWTVLIILALLSGFFKIRKKEIDPLGWVFGLIGKMLTKDVRKDILGLKKDTEKKFEEIKKDRADKVDELKADYNKQNKEIGKSVSVVKKEVNSMKSGTARNCETLKKRMDKLEAESIKSNDLQTIRQIRAHILDFANSCMNKRKHTKLDFENIFEEDKRYKALVKKYNIENDVYKEDYDYIRKIYRKCQREGTFLKESET